MKVILAVALFVAVVAAKHPRHGGHMKRGLAEDMVSAGEELVRVLHNKFFADNKYCSVEDSLALHRAKLRHLDCEKLGEFMAERSLRRHRGEKKDRPHPGKFIKGFVQKLRKDKCLRKELSSTCRPRAIFHGVKTIMQNHEEVNQTAFEVYGKYDSLVAVHKSVMNAIHSAGAQIKEEYFPETACSDEDLYKIGEAIKEHLKGRRHHGKGRHGGHDDDDDDDKRGRKEGPSDEELEEFRADEGISDQCTVDEIRSVGKAIFDNLEGIGKIVKDAIGAALEQYNPEEVCAKLKAAGACQSTRAFQLESFSSRNAEEQVGELLSSAYFY